MLIQNLAPTALVLAGLLAGPAPAPRSAPAPRALQDGMGEREIKELGGLLAKALDKDKQDLKDKDKSRGAVRAFLEELGKKRKAKDPVGETLALSADLGRALFESANYQMKGVKPGKISGVTIVDDKNKPTDVRYAVWVPAAYKTNSGAYPLLLCIPGMKDGKPYNPEIFLQEHWLEADSTLREKVVIAACEMPAEAAAWTEGQTAEGKSGGIAIAMLTLKHLRDTYAIDANRVFVAGRESGVPVAVLLGSRFPHVWAGVIGRAGDAGKTGPENFRNLPTFFAGGGAECTAFEEKTKADGYDNCTLKPDGTDADVATWIADHPRVANPPKITLAGTSIPNNAYWLRIPPMDTQGSGVRIEAEIDRAANSVTVTTTGGVKSLTLRLNDQLVDLSKPVKIVLNGNAQESVLPRNLDDTLDMMYAGTSDPGRVYTATKSFDLPAQ
jgi:hypothetical protein